MRSESRATAVVGETLPTSAQTYSIQQTVRLTPPVNQEINRLLARELGRLGGPLAGWVSRFLPTNVGMRTVDLPQDLGNAGVTVVHVLERVGTQIELVEDLLAFAAATHCGVGRLNPAVVAVRLQSVSPARTRITVVGFAKEGLIKQRGGEQVATEVASLLTRWALESHGAGCAVPCTDMVPERLRGTRARNSER